MRRRDLLFTAGALGLSLLLPGRAPHAARARDRRFFLDIIVPGGLDQTMLFDARPLAMTQAGLVHNPLGEEPAPWQGTNGTASLTASPAAPLHPLRDRFSVVNGILMSTSFDGHDQNTNVLLTGSPFGGPSLHTELNADAPAPLDYIRFGTVFAQLQDARAVELTPPGLRRLVQGVGELSAVAPAVERYLSAQTDALGDPSQRFGAGVLALRDGTASAQALQAQLASIQLAGDDGDPLGAQLSVLREVFRLGIARGAMFAIVTGNELQFDTHAAPEAVTQAPRYLDLCERLARVFRFLAATPYDDTRSLLDVVTVMVSSEFGRTMRQAGAPIDGTGTDHNPLANSVLLGGAGIRSGLVVGATDFQTAGEELSGAHLALDPARVKVMGRPFDFATGAARGDRPATFVATDYLHIASVVNTLYAAFGVDRSAWRTVERNGPPAPAIAGLLA
ncbi:MAG: DUF1501 domain-containing protein [Deltaproteobacteria bacterium]|nr:DUF1501 domain-containing protein [Deltaproteobacteria bacterium]